MSSDSKYVSLHTNEIDDPNIDGNEKSTPDEPAQYEEQGDNQEGPMLPEKFNLDEEVVEEMEKYCYKKSFKDNRVTVEFKTRYSLLG